MFLFSQGLTNTKYEKKPLHSGSKAFFAEDDLHLSANSCLVAHKNSEYM